MRLGLACVLVLVTACGEREISGTACSTDTDCNLFNAQGTCEATGFCSYPDPTCIGGQRYAPGAGDSLANICVGDQACGAKDLPCCDGTVCADNLVCAAADTTMSCQCGGANQPCCDGTTCGANLFCGVGATCVNNEVQQVAVGAGHTCALLGDNAVWCWGSDVRGYSMREGVGVPVISFDHPTRIEGLSNVAELRAGEFHTCAKKTDGTLWCWGHDDQGQLGDGTFVSSIVPKQVQGLTNVTQFDTGRASTCALGRVGGVNGLYCWGRGGVESRTAVTQLGGRLGNGGVANSNVPVAVDMSAAAPAGQTVRTFAVGNYHTCMVMSDNTVWCWGKNQDGQLGNATAVSSMVPVQVVMTGVTIPSGVTIDEVALSDGPRQRGGGSCMRLSDSSIYCWGIGTRGDLGDGTAASRQAPTAAVSTVDLAGAKPVDVVAAANVRCVRTDTKEVFCWGYSRNGVLGNGGTANTNYPTPQKIALPNVEKLDASHHTVCAIDSAKQLYCWGANRSGNASGRSPLTPAEDFIATPFHVVF